MEFCEVYTTYTSPELCKFIYILAPMGFQSYIKHIMYDLLGKHSIRHQFAHFVECLDQSIYALFQWMACGIIFQKIFGSIGFQWSCHDS